MPFKFLVISFCGSKVFSECVDTLHVQRFTRILEWDFDRMREYIHSKYFPVRFTKTAKILRAAVSWVRLRLVKVLLNKGSPSSQKE